jgi:hypothetical protein
MIKDKVRGCAAPASLAPSPPDAEAGCNEVQAALFLGLSPRTLQAWRVRGGGPPYLKIGRVVRYQRRALIDFQRTHTVISTSDADARRVVEQA